MKRTLEGKYFKNLSNSLAVYKDILIDKDILMGLIDNVCIYNKLSENVVFNHSRTADDSITIAAHDVVVNETVSFWNVKPHEFNLIAILPLDILRRVMDGLEYE